MQGISSRSVTTRGDRKKVVKNTFVRAYFSIILTKQNQNNVTMVPKHQKKFEEENDMQHLVQISP